MKRAVILALFVAGLALLVTFPAAADCGCTFQVSTPNHTQTLGGKAGMAPHQGLHTAADRSGVVVHVPG